MIPFQAMVERAVQNELERQSKLPRLRYDLLVRAVWAEMERVGYQAPATGAKPAETAANRRETEVGDVIEITAAPGADLWPWRGSVVVVDKVEAFGARAMNTTPAGAYWVRLGWSDFRWTGGTVVMPISEKS